MGADDRAARHAGEHLDATQDVALGEPREHAEVVERRAEPAAGQRQAHLADRGALQRGGRGRLSSASSARVGAAASSATSAQVGERGQLGRRRLLPPEVLGAGGGGEPLSCLVEPAEPEQRLTEGRVAQSPSRAAGSSTICRRIPSACARYAAALSCPPRQSVLERGEPVGDERCVDPRVPALRIAHLLEPALVAPQRLSSATGFASTSHDACGSPRRYRASPRSVLSSSEVPAADLQRLVETAGCGQFEILVRAQRMLLTQSLRVRPRASHARSSRRA